MAGHVGVHVVEQNNYARALVYDGTFFAETEVDADDADVRILEEHEVVLRIEFDGITIERRLGRLRFEFDPD